MDQKYLSSTRRVKVDVDALEVGMFVCDLDRPWEDSPFLLQGFALENPDDVSTVQSVCDYVYVDTGKSTRKHSSNKPTFQSKKRQNYVFKSSFEDSFAQNSQRYDRTHDLVKSTMEDIRFGNAIDTSAAKAAVKDCVDGILENPNTMILLTQIKNKDEYTSQQ